METELTSKARWACRAWWCTPRIPPGSGDLRRLGRGEGKGQWPDDSHEVGVCLGLLFLFQISFVDMV